MTNRTWIGGGSNQSTNSTDWSPMGVPQPNDDLTMTGGTMNLVGDNLANDTLKLVGSGPDTLNLSKHADISASMDDFSGPPSATFDLTDSTLNLTISSFFGTPPSAVVNIHGTNTLVSSTSNGEEEVDLKPNSVLVGSFNQSGGDIKINGASHASFLNQDSKLAGGTDVIGADVLGSGKFELVNGTLRFLGSVGSDQAVTLDGNFRLLELDRPNLFRGSVLLNNGGQVDLLGLAQADSYSYQNDLLSIWARNTVIDTLRVTDTAGFFVSKDSSSGIVSAISDNAGSSSIPLPMHTS